MPEAYRGLDRFEARKKIVADLEALGLLDKIEPITHAVPHDEKTKTVVLEPYLTEQWYLNVKPLAEKAIKAVEDGRTKFVPENWANVYFNWLRNIQPWCISRQLWWGHQIPVWYGPQKEGDRLPYGFGTERSRNRLFVAETADAAKEEAENFYGKPVELLSSESELFRDDVIRAMEEGNRTVFIWRDPDVLDTWFSSALWPFSTLGWPDETRN